jgi:hypothetical protein
LDAHGKIFAMPATQPASDRRIAFVAALLLLAFPCALFLLNDSWAYNNNFRFSAIYTGYFLHWPEYLQMYPPGYQASRVPWLAPGWLAFYWLSPGKAHLALRVLVIAGAAVPTWLTLRRLGAGSPGAAIGVMLLTSNPFFLQAAGWDYVNGAGILCIAWSLCFLTGAAQSPLQRPAWLLGAGAAMIASLWTYLMVAFFAPAYAWIYLRQRGWPASRDAVRELSWLVLGGVACTGFFGLINRAMGGNFLFFLKQFEVSGGKIAAANDAYESPFLWLPGAVWLISFGLSMVAGLLLAMPSVRRAWGLSRGAEAAGIALIIAFVSLALLDVSGTWGALEYTCGTHASYLLPFAALPLGLVIDRHLAPLKLSSQVGLMFLAAGLLLLAYYAPLAAWVAHGRMLWRGAFVCVVIVAAFLMAAFRRPSVLGLLVILVGLSWLNPRTVAGTTWRLNPPVSPRDQHLLAFDLLSTINALDSDGRLMIWYSRNPQKPDDSSVAEYAAVMKSSSRQMDRVLASFPNFNNPAQVKSVPISAQLEPYLHPGARAVLLGDPSRLPQARAVLAKLNLDLRILQQQQVTHGKASIPLTLLEIDRLHS